VFSLSKTGEGKDRQFRSSPDVIRGSAPTIPVFKKHNPHPEEQTPVCVSKDGSLRSGSSFETVAARPPQDEVREVEAKTGMDGTS
jgi:hypothetical protein